MKALFKKSWFTGVLALGLLLLIFLIDLWVMNLKLRIPYQNDTMMSLARDISDGDFINIFSFVLRILFFVAFIPLLLSGLSVFKKTNWGLTTGVLYFLGFNITLIVYQASYNALSIFSIILIIFNFILMTAIFITLIIRKKTLIENSDIKVTEKDKELTKSKIPLSVLIIDFVALAIALSTFFIPLYTLGGIDPYRPILISVLFTSDLSYDVIIYFFYNFVIFLSIFLYLSRCLTYYFFDKSKFITESKSFINFIFVTTIIFFITGLSISTYYTLTGSIASTPAFIPMILMSVVIFAYSIFRGKYNAFEALTVDQKQMKYPRIEPLLYVILLTAISVLMLLLYIVKIEISYGTYTNSVRLSGLDILRDYAVLDPGYRIIAFILVTMLITVGITLVTSISSYLSKHKQFSKIVILATVLNIFFVFAISISGFYFQIAKEINQSVLIEIFSTYGINLLDSITYDYKVGTDAIYALIAAVIVLVIMFARKSFDRDELTPLEATLSSSSDISTTGDEAVPADAYDDENLQNFDPCPAFTDLDQSTEIYEKDLEKREGFKVKETSLNDLVNFVVEYARNSRLHLSYTPEDIATFVSGMGASKLSILQGMSGTGKTSLPKIFSEAIYGNIDIIEVESSWKDKNELLGYYNEFSMKYTPKKFTLALYKAALNKEIFTIILLDEMNLSRIEYYFSDFLSLMENEEEYREIKLINIKLNRKEDDEEIEYKALEHGNTLKVPANVWFIGTANRDESTFVISDKVYDRAHTMNFTKRAPKVRNYQNPIARKYYDYEIINDLFMDAKAAGDFDAEQNEIIKKVEVLLAPFNISFGNRILKQIEDFVNIYKACFPNEDVEKEAVEKILLSKVVAKLEVKTIDDKEQLEMEFDKLDLKLCAEFIKRLDNE
ncbi:hypothetical protein BK010_00555 [Tenericutes bacterium MO-XQ]|nr:hypothetical protein BK010_00555 [Tenericutes bacterium MO-XQ]